MALRNITARYAEGRISSPPLQRARKRRGGVRLAWEDGGTREAARGMRVRRGMRKEGVSEGKDEKGC